MISWLIEFCKGVYTILCRDHLLLQIWSDRELSKHGWNDLRSYCSNTLKQMQASFPEIQIFSIRLGGFILGPKDGYCDPFGGMWYYVIRISNNAPKMKLKELCTKLELADGIRISDIDIFHKGKKISRHALMQSS